MKVVLAEEREALATAKRELDAVRGKTAEQSAQIRELKERTEAKTADCEDLERGLAEAKHLLTTELQSNHRYSAETARNIDDLNRKNKQLQEDLQRS